MIDEAVQQRLDSLVQARINRNEAQIAHSLRQIAAGNPLGAETQENRRVARLSIKTGDRRQAEALSASIRQTAKEVEPRGARMLTESIRVMSDDMAEPAVAVPAPEAVWGTPDFVGVEFFSRGRRAANAVGRVMFRSGRVQGIGFLVAPGVLLTNNHVIESALSADTMAVQFDFELDDSGITDRRRYFGLTWPDASSLHQFSPWTSPSLLSATDSPATSGSMILATFRYPMRATNTCSASSRISSSTRKVGRNRSWSATTI
jgi:endonuclease G